MKTIEQFYEQLKTDPELQQKLAAAQAEIKGTDPNAAFGLVEPVIREAGYGFGLEELEAYAEANNPDPNGELSIAELEAVAGGGDLCVIAGKGDDCFCLFMGGGTFTDVMGFEYNNYMCFLAGMNEFC